MELSGNPGPWNGPERASGNRLLRPIKHEAVVDGADATSDITQGVTREGPPRATGLKEIESGPNIDPDRSLAKPPDRFFQSIPKLSSSGGVHDDHCTQGASQSLVGEVDRSIKELGWVQHRKAG